MLQAVDTAAGKCSNHSKQPGRGREHGEQSTIRNIREVGGHCLNKGFWCRNRDQGSRSGALCSLGLTCS